MTVCPLGAFVTSHLQQKRNSATVRDLAVQRALLNQLRKFGTTSTFKRPSKGSYKISVLMFADAGRPSEFGQLAFVGGLLIGPLEKGSVLHTLSWKSGLSKRPVKSIGSAEVLAAGISIDEGKLLSSVFKILLGIDIALRRG